MGAFPDVFSSTNSRSKVEVNQGLDLDLRLQNLVITGACLSSRKDRVHIKKSGESQVKEDWL